MQKIISLWKTLQAATGIKLEILGLLVALLVGYADWINGQLIDQGIMKGGNEGAILGIPSWMLGITFGMGYLLLWFFIYAHKLRTQIEEARVELSLLRKEGVVIRNYAYYQLQGNYDDDAEPWEDKSLIWQKRVYASLKKISVADAEWFDTLDVVEPPRRNFTMEQDEKMTDGQFHRFAQLDFQLLQLGKMIRDLWGKK